MKRTLVSIKIPCHLEPSGLFRSDGKRPDGASISPWKGRKVLIWDVTCPDTLAPSHLTLAVREARAVADDAEFRKTQKYSNLVSSHYFVPLAVESWGVWEEARSFLKELRQRSEIIIRQPYGTPISGAADLSGCTKRKHCCNAREHWTTEGRELVFLGGCCIIL